MRIGRDAERCVERHASARPLELELGDLLRNMSNNPARVAGREHALGDVPGDDAPGPDHRARADRTPGKMIAPPPTHTSDPISTGLPNSCFRRRAASIGCSGGVDLDGRAEQGVVPDRTGTRQGRRN